MDPSACVRRAVEMVLEQYRLEDIEITAEIPEEAHVVMGHPIRPEQVLVNLLSNARGAILEMRRKRRTARKARLPLPWPMIRARAKSP